MGVVGEYLAAFDFQLYLQKRHGVAPNATRQFHISRAEISDFFDGLKQYNLNSKVKIDFDSGLISGFEEFRIERGKVVVERDERAPLEMRLSPQQMMVYAAPDPRDSYGVLFSKKGAKDGFELQNGTRFALVYPVGSRLNDERYQNYVVSAIRMKNPAPVRSRQVSMPAQRLLNAIAKRVNDGVINVLREVYRDVDFTRYPDVEISSASACPLNERIFLKGGKHKGNRQAVVVFGADPSGAAIKLPRRKSLETRTSLLLDGKLPYPYYVGSAEKDGIIYTSILVDLPE